MNIAPYILGLCLTHIPGDPILSVSLCRMAYEAQHRDMQVVDDWDDQRREWFYQEVKSVVWPKPG